MHLRLRQFGAACVLAMAISSAAHAQQDEDKTPLGKKMSAMNTAFKAVGRQVDDASKNANTLEQLTTIETNAKAALTMVPAKKEKVPAAEQAKFQAGYEAGMKEFLAAVAKLRVSIKAGKNAEAVVIYDEIKALQREGHKEYRIKKAGAPPGGI
ncbi:cytochrome b562 [Gemmatimonas sp.]|uniref:cytochrome b562 n=1 Tax=Gemmatimonas sp. TaxID=1962908 RepID=UPI003982FD0F